MDQVTYEKFVRNTGAAVYGKLNAGDSEVKQWREFLEKAAESKDPLVAGSGLLFLADLPNNIVSFTGVNTDRQLCKEICRNKVEILDYHKKRVADLSRELISKSRTFNIKHAERRHCLTQAIKNLIQIIDEGAEYDTLLLLAEACYLRGKIIMPKGFSVPEKKLEFFGLAARYLQRIEECDPAPGDKERQYITILKANIDLDLIRFNQQPSCPLLQTLQTACLSIELNQVESFEVRRVLLALANRETKWAKKTGKRFLEKIQNSGEIAALDRSRASLSLGEIDTCLAMAETAVNTMRKNKVPFSHEDWEVLVQLLATLWESNRDDAKIQKIIILTWKTVCRLEQGQKQGLHIRWYWSRQQHLYDLAFHAAGNDLQIRAEVADSLKSRPALHLSTAADMGVAVETEMAGFLDRYIIGLDSARGNDAHNKKKKTYNDSKNWQKTPSDWISIHFYLSDGFGHSTGKAVGYALIHDPSDKERPWKKKEFSFETIWEHYCIWQEQHYKAAKEYEKNKDWEKRAAFVAPFLDKLCWQIGKEMSWLFDESLFPEGKDPVVLIPHDFLHRLPLHFAIQEKEGQKTVFMDQHPVTFLPAWWMAKPASVRPAPPPAGIKNRILVKHGLQESLKASLKNNDETLVITDAKPDDLLSITSAPVRLGLYMHGQAPYGNPYDARLKFSGGDVTIYDLLSSDINIQGSEVILSACETDMMPPLTTPVDEHVSFAMAFLQKKAVAVIGSLWEARDGNEGLKDLLVQSIAGKNKNKTTYEQLWDWSDQAIVRYQNGDLNEIYNIAAMRVIGLPLFQEGKNDKKKK